MEALDAPKHHTLPGSHSRALPAHFNVGARRGAKGIYYQPSGHGPGWSCGRPPSILLDCTDTFPSYLVSLMVSITSTPVTWSTGVSTGCVIV